MQQQIDTLTDKENDWLQTQLGIAKRFVDVYAPGDNERANEPLPSLETLDRAWSAWLSTQENDLSVVNGIINAVGIAFGQWLVNEAPLQWVIATDANGSDLAVYGLPNQADVLVYPANLVAKRYERREENFLARLHQEITTQVKALSKQPEAKRKPWWKLR